MNFILWLAAFSPIVLVLFLMLVLGWSSAKAGSAACLAALLVAYFGFGAGWELLAYSQVKAALLTLYVLYIVWGGLTFYHVINEAGGIRAISSGVERLSEDRAFQLLIIGWVFSSFLQGVAGFGVPVAVVAPILVGLGFSPIVAVAAPAIGHSWSVTFGNMATSFEALVGVTGVPGDEIVTPSAVLLAIGAILCGFAVVHSYGGFGELRRNFMRILIIGLAMAAAQFLIVKSGIWTLGVLGATLVGLLTCLALAFPRLRKPQRVGWARAASCSMPLWWAVSAYLIFFLVVGVTSFVPIAKEFSNQFYLELHFPELQTDMGWTNPPGSGSKISVFGHPGAQLFYAAGLVYGLFRWLGSYDVGAARRIVRKTFRNGMPTSIGMATMIGLALVMDQSGMTYLLAEGVSIAMGDFFPLFAPAIGALGAFMTGSTTNSNVVFGVFQKSAAEVSALSVSLILAGQTAGASIGSMIAPAKILVGCSTVGLAGREAPVLRVTLSYGTVITAILGIQILLMSHFS